MDYGRIIDESFGYTKDGLAGNLGTWILLIILALLPAIPIGVIFAFMVISLMAGTAPNIPLFVGALAAACILAAILGSFYQGYMVRIYRGEDTLPAVDGFTGLFSDGIRYLVITIIYAIPVLLILLVSMGALILASLSAGPDIRNIFALLGGAIAGIITALVVGFVLTLFLYIGVVRFARMGKIREAFNFAEIRNTIGKIGWGPYILAVIILFVIVILVSTVLAFIPFIGPVLQVILAPVLSIFSAKYITLVYDSQENTGDLKIPAQD
ncbi:MAG: hypothetical protein APR55_06775 [Methanolinea sp. SDB]|nr:MAG: hypothetical protein APR55_06775 [Methanolinea sp. SDB]